MFTSTDYSLDDEVRSVRTLLDYRVDGLILTVADAMKSSIPEMLKSAGVQYVLIYNVPCANEHPTVTVDNIAAGREVARTLIKLGHERLGMISGQFVASDRARARRDGFMDGAAEHCLAAPTVFEVDFVLPHLEETLAPIYTERETAPSALFCSNDLLAISVIGALGRLGLEVPNDVSVIGFDGIAVGTHLHPTLATVIQPSHEMGRAATRQLLDRLAGKDCPMTEILPHTLRLGESAGPAAKPSPPDLRNPNR